MGSKVFANRGNSGVTPWLDADAQWQKLEDTLFSVTRSMDKGVPAVHQAIMSAFGEEGTASESSRRARFLQGALEYDLMLMVRAPSADQWGLSSMESPSSASSAGSCHSGDTSLNNDSDTSARSFSRNAHRDWDSVPATPRTGEASKASAGQSSCSCPETAEASQVSGKWKQFKQRARRGLRFQWSST